MGAVYGGSVWGAVGGLQRAGLLVGHCQHLFDGGDALFDLF